MSNSRTLWGIRAIAAFFMFGALISGLASLSLAFAGGPLEVLWRINPYARAAFATMGLWAVVLMATVCVACIVSAAGLWKRCLLGYLLAIGVLTVNLIGDTVTAIIRGDPTTLIGLPIGAAFIFYLVHPRSRALFVRQDDA